jgi:TrmH family RNA methyltransferase
MQSTGLIKSRTNPLVQRLRRLKQRAGAGSGLMLLEGPKLVLEALASGVEIEEAAFSPRALEGPSGRAALEALRAKGVEPRALDEALLSSLSEVETSQGLLALGRRPAFGAETLYRPPALVLVLVAVQNPGNLGGLLRTAEAAGATGALLTTGCADPFSWKALRGSMGSAFRLPHLCDVALARALDGLCARGLRLVATSADAALRHDEADLAAPCALVLGNEAAGLPEAVLARADVRVRIPMAGRVESLNVGVAAGVLLFEAARQRRRQAGR